MMWLPRRTNKYYDDANAANSVECPVCNGGSTGDTPFCSHCWGYGWVDRGTLNETCPGHKWKHEDIGRCMTQISCACGASRIVDSSG
jgi:hypothetical protein